MMDAGWMAAKHATGEVVMQQVKLSSGGVPAAQFGAAIVSTGPQVVRTQVGSRLSDQWPVFWRARFWREVDRDADG